MTVIATVPSEPSASDGTALPLNVTKLTKQFRRQDGTVVHALNDISLSIAPGEMLVLLGPSGCGKTTLLRCVAGLEVADSGRIDLAGTPVFEPSTRTLIGPEKRDINMMFQTYALWPHMTLIDNVAYPLLVAGFNKRNARSQAQEFLDLVGIGELGSQYPSGVSGGQQQRAALARTLVNRPALVLFDEPLSNVDAQVRHQLRAEIARLHRELGFAGLYVTHDQSEALSLGDRIAVMQAGSVVECDAPFRLYQAPTRQFVARFLGVANIDRIEADLSSRILGDVHDVPGASEGSSVFWRPEQSRFVDETETVDRTTTFLIMGYVEQRLFTGTFTQFDISCDGGSIQVWTTDLSNPHQEGDRVTVAVPKSAVRVVR